LLCWNKYDGKAILAHDEFKIRHEKIPYGQSAQRQNMESIKKWVWQHEAYPNFHYNQSSFKTF